MPALDSDSCYHTAPTSDCSSCPCRPCSLSQEWFDSYRLLAYARVAVMDLDAMPSVRDTVRTHHSPFP